MNNPELLDVIPHQPAESDSSDASGAAHCYRRGVGIWGVLFVLVILFGYLTASRRKAFGTLVEQVVDIVRDFRGYDPEF